mmetsp:Transcript_10623/g.20048  ORF Transcript_10623/g.20048 Transcript_10623/m.20048 type:complete len:242 (+) Transcript_10623:3-728(+)
MDRWVGGWILAIHHVIQANKETAIHVEIFHAVESSSFLLAAGGSPVGSALPSMGCTGRTRFLGANTLVGELAQLGGAAEGPVLEDVNVKAPELALANENAGAGAALAAALKVEEEDAAAAEVAGEERAFAFSICWTRVLTTSAFSQHCETSTPCFAASALSSDGERLCSCSGVIAVKGVACTSLFWVGAIPTMASLSISFTFASSASVVLASSEASMIFSLRSSARSARLGSSLRTAWAFR